MQIVTDSGTITLSAVGGRDDSIHVVPLSVTLMEYVPGWRGFQAGRVLPQLAETGQLPITSQPSAASLPNCTAAWR